MLKRAPDSVYQFTLDKTRVQFLMFFKWGDRNVNVIFEKYDFFSSHFFSNILIQVWYLCQRLRNKMSCCCLLYTPADLTKSRTTMDHSPCHRHWLWWLFYLWPIMAVLQSNWSSRLIIQEALLCAAGSQISAVAHFDMRTIRARLPMSRVPVAFPVAGDSACSNRGSIPMPICCTLGKFVPLPPSNPHPEMAPSSVPTPYPRCHLICMWPDPV